jgi:hypothetical protein
MPGRQSQEGVGGVAPAGLFSFWLGGFVRRITSTMSVLHQPMRICSPNSPRSMVKEYILGRGP